MPYAQGQFFVKEKATSRAWHMPTPGAVPLWKEPERSLDAAVRRAKCEQRVDRLVSPGPEI